MRARVGLNHSAPYRFDWVTGVREQFTLAGKRVEAAQDSESLIDRRRSHRCAVYRVGACPDLRPRRDQRGRTIQVSMNIRQVGAKVCDGTLIGLEGTAALRPRELLMKPQGHTRIKRRCIAAYYIHPHVILQSHPDRGGPSMPA